MRILEYGKIKPITCKCERCEAVFEYTDVDFQYNTVRGYFIKCPVCYMVCRESYNRSDIYPLKETT